MSTLKQYYELKAKHPDALLLFRCGDFYECYKDDAQNAAKVLGITVTYSENYGALTGFPYHALDTYLPKLIRAGHRVAICDQLEAPKKVIKRGETDKDSYKMKLPLLTKKQYELLCECIRYRCADNDKERSEAMAAGKFTAWYDDMSNQLSELKSLIYDKTARDTYK